MSDSTTRTTSEAPIAISESDEVQGYVGGAAAFGSAVVFGVVGAPCYLLAYALIYASGGSVPHGGSGGGGGARG